MGGFFFKHNTIHIFLLESEFCLVLVRYGILNKFRRYGILNQFIGYIYIFKWIEHMHPIIILKLL